MPHIEKMDKANKDECARVKALFDAEKARTGMTQATLGKMCGKSEKTISAIVNGRMRVTVAMGRKLAKVFGVPLAQILPWTESLAGDAQHADIMEAVQALSPDNQAVARRLVQRLLESQEGD